MKIKKIDRRLNIVIEVTNEEDGVACYVHAAPIAEEVFNANYLLLARVIADLYGQGFTVAMSTRLAKRHMLKVAEELGLKEECAALIAEMHRNVNVLAPVAAGWDKIPYDEALKTGIIDEEDAAALGNLLCFFTAASWVQTPVEMVKMVHPVFHQNGVRTTSLGSMEWINSLSTSMKEDPTGPKAPASSIPS